MQAIILQSVEYFSYGLNRESATKETYSTDRMDLDNLNQMARRTCCAILNARLEKDKKCSCKPHIEPVLDGLDSASKGQFRAGDYFFYNFEE